MPRRIPNPHDRNFLLATMPPEDLARLAPDLEGVSLQLNVMLERPQVVIEHVYFLDSGIGSTVAIAGRSERIEVGVFGRDGMSGPAIVLGDDRTPHETYMQIAGAGRRIARVAFQRAMDQSPTLQRFLLRYVQTLAVQTAHTALANGRAKLEQRLSRSILMCHDRVEGDELHITHDGLAVMLGVRRAGVTVGTHLLEGQGLIRASRGLIVVLDRAGLEKSARSAYGVPEVEYARRLG